MRERRPIVAYVEPTAIPGGGPFILHCAPFTATVQGHRVQRASTHLSAVASDILEMVPVSPKSRVTTTAESDRVPTPTVATIHVAQIPTRVVRPPRPRIAITESTVVSPPDGFRNDTSAAPNS